MKKIYLAVPYTHEDMSVKIARFEAVNKKAGELMVGGNLVFSPISHTHPIALQCELPGHWEFWEQYDRTFLGWADEIHVLCLPGWRESTGVSAELKIADEMGMPRVLHGI